MWEVDGGGGGARWVVDEVLMKEGAFRRVESF
jgi:hypothetical protein